MAIESLLCGIVIGVIIEGLWAWLKIHRLLGEVISSASHNTETFLPHRTTPKHDIIPHNCGTCYELTCPTNKRCGECGILKGFPKWRISVDARILLKKGKNCTCTVK